MPLHLDLRNLPPPEPMEQILDAVESLRPGDYIDALTPFWPSPLLPLLETQGCAWRREACPTGHHARIRIFLREDAAPASATA